MFSFLCFYLRLCVLVDQATCISTDQKATGKYDSEYKDVFLDVNGIVRI